MTVAQVAAEFGATKATIQRWCREGKIAAVKPGGDRLGYLIPRSEVERMMTPKQA